MFRVILYGILGLLVGLILGVILDAIFAPTVPLGGTTPAITWILLGVGVIVGVAAAMLLAYSLNRRDVEPDRIEYSKTPPPVFALILLDAWMSAFSFLGGILGILILQNVGFPINTMSLLMLDAVLLALGAFVGILNIRYLELQIPLANESKFATNACLFFAIGSVVSNWSLFLANPLALLGVFILLIPTYLVIQCHFRNG